MNILLLAGAGTSIELGVPGMVGMATEFLAHSKQWGVEPGLVERILGQSLDIEHLIEDLDRICMARPSLEAMGHDANFYGQVDKARAEVEWFVQHSAERVAARDAQIMWGGVLRATRSSAITFVTTNYDRSIELAANAEDVQLDDGFGTFAESETAPWIGFGSAPGTHDWSSFMDRLTGTPTVRQPFPSS